MGARGPVPASHALKKMRKTQPSRMGPDISITGAEAKRQLLPTTPPKHLREEAAECWKFITATQVKMVEGGRQPLIGKSERMLLEVACVNYRQWRRAVRLFDENLARLERKAKEEGVGPEVAHRRVMISTKRRSKGPPEEVVSADQMLLERTEDRVRKSFRSLGLPQQTPTMILQLETETASGDKMAARLLR